MATALAVDVYASMEASLFEAVDRENERNKKKHDDSGARLGVAAGPEQGRRPDLPMTEFYSDSRFSEGRGGARQRCADRVSAAAEEDATCLYCLSHVASRATIRCLSCATYDPKLRGHYCDACFESRHPEYRAPHSWSRLTDAEDFRRQMVCRERRAQAVAHGEAIVDLQRSIAGEAEKFEKLRVDSGGDDLIKAVERTAHNTTISITRLRRALRAPRRRLADVGRLAMWEVDPDHAAASLFQRAWRCAAARRELAHRASECIAKVYDPASGFYYFVDRRTNATSWEPPAALWRDGMYRASIQGPTVDAKRQAMQRAAEHISTALGANITTLDDDDDELSEDDEFSEDDASLEEEGLRHADSSNRLHSPEYGSEFTYGTDITSIS